MKLSETLYFNRTNLKVEGFKKKGDHVLIFTFQPFKRTWVQCLACFLSVGNTIDAVMSDGASWNRSMWNLFGVTKKCVSIHCLQLLIMTKQQIIKSNRYYPDLTYFVFVIVTYYSNINHYIIFNCTYNSNTYIQGDSEQPSVH
ncbi:hypothetical protein ACFW04_013830 [Cataglyphis niger]